MSADLRETLEEREQLLVRRHEHALEIYGAESPHTKRAETLLHQTRKQIDELNQLSLVFTQQPEQPEQTKTAGREEFDRPLTMTPSK